MSHEPRKDQWRAGDRKSRGPEATRRGMGEQEAAREALDARMGEAFTSEEVWRLDALRQLTELSLVQVVGFPGDPSFVARKSRPIKPENVARYVKDLEAGGIEVTVNPVEGKYASLGADPEYLMGKVRESEPLLRRLLDVAAGIKDDFSAHATTQMVHGSSMSPYIATRFIGLLEGPPPEVVDRVETPRRPPRTEAGKGEGRA
jgi:hypothetical protein